MTFDLFVLYVKEIKTHKKLINFCILFAILVLCSFFDKYDLDSNSKSKPWSKNQKFLPKFCCCRCYCCCYFGWFLVLKNMLRKVKTYSEACKACALRTYEKKITIISGLSITSKCLQCANLCYRFGKKVETIIYISVLFVDIFKGSYCHKLIMRNLSRKSFCFRKLQ